MIKKPNLIPSSPNFSTGPTKKYDSFSLKNIDTTLLGRSHRSKEATIFFQDVTNKLKKFLKIPTGYEIVFTPGSDTGAIEMALWNLLGYIPVDIIHWEHFGSMWKNTIESELRIKNIRSFASDYGKFPDIQEVNFNDHDVVFTLCGTTSGVLFIDFDKIPENRNGLIITDATSYLLSKEIEWGKIDVLTFSWQKCLGGEAQNGVMVLSPRAIDRLNSYIPNRGIPNLFKMKDINGRVNQSLFQGSPINTPSLLCFLDFVEALNWAESIGGMDFCIKKSEETLSIITKWVKNSNWISFLCEDIKRQSSSSLCLKVIDKSFLSLEERSQKLYLAQIFSYLKENKIAYDIESYPKAPLGIRVWGGVTVKTEDIKILTTWLDYTYSCLREGQTIK